jgi:hypothetical protein
MKPIHVGTAPVECVAGHESPEVDMPRTILSAASVAATVVISCVVCRWVFFGHLQPIGERSATPMNGRGLVLPPAPRLEGIEMMSGPPDDGGQSSAATQLQSYGWVDRDKGLVRVPIDRAMQLAIERNWLASAAEPAKTATPPTSPSTSAKGRTSNTK